MSETMDADLGWTGHAQDPRITPPSHGTTMPLSPMQEILAERIAYHVGEKLKLEMKEWTTTQIHLHSSDCPVAKKVDGALGQAAGGWKVIATAGLVAGTMAGLVVMLVDLARHWPR